MVPPTPGQMVLPAPSSAGSKAPNAPTAVNGQVPGLHSQEVKALLNSIAMQVKRTVAPAGTAPQVGSSASARHIEDPKPSAAQRGADPSQGAATAAALRNNLLASLAKAGAGLALAPATVLKTAPTSPALPSPFLLSPPVLSPPPVLSLQLAAALGVKTAAVLPSPAQATPSSSLSLDGSLSSAFNRTFSPASNPLPNGAIPMASQVAAATKTVAGSTVQPSASGNLTTAAQPALEPTRVLANQLPTNQPNPHWAATERAVPRQIGGTMLSPEGVNMMPRPNTVYVEGAAAGVRIEPEQARTLGLRAGETITAIVAQRQDGNILLIGNQQLPLPDRMNLPPGQVSLLVRMMAGQPVLALTDPALAASVAAANSRVDADGRFARLLNHVGSFHLLQLFAPGQLGALAEKVASPELRSALAALLLDSRQLSSGNLRQAFQNTGLFAEHQAALNPNQAMPGLKSMLLALRSLMQARQMETTSLSGAIDELEARQVDSLAQQSAGRSHYAWMIPFADQYPVFLDLQHHQNTDGEGASQESWTVDLEVGLTSSVSMAANVRVSVAGELGLRLWLPDSTFYQMAQAGRDQLEAMLSQNGLTLAGLAIYPVPRDAGSVNHGQQRLGVSIDA
ncbi:MAG: hypothetical protein ISQ65_07445 [Pseudomonadales bacterium]|nr:hypothetical protein [Pseudomonadales bacterium]